MEEVRELKGVLEKVEGKIIAAANVYGAMNFAYWLAVMAFFYVILGFAEMGIWQLLYWLTAVIVGIYVSGSLWKRIERLGGAEGDGRWFLLIGLAWGIGAVVGWWLIPAKTTIGVNEEARLAVGFLTFIGLSLLGQWMVMGRGKAHYEMVPSFLVPFLGIPFALGMEKGAMVWAGYVVATGFTLTVLLYLYSAFKAVER
jgi:hypothetical protein